jgi:hypothetical protein
VYREVPSIWAHLPLSPPPPNGIIEGYIRIFDPDVLVTCGNVDATVGCGNDRKIISVGELTGELSKRGVPGHGIGLFEILRRFAEKEFKFVRRNPLKVLVPTYEAAESQLFLTAIFGDVPPEAPREIYESLFQYIETDQPSAGIDTYVNLMDGKSPFLRHLCNFDLNIRRPSTDRSDAIFLLDHTNALDIIDYWNLRAIGWTVVPIASAVKVSDGAKKLAQDFIAEHEGRDEEFPNFEHRVTILKGRSIAEDDHIAFVNSLRRKPGQILTCQLWYPPMWDEFTYQRGNLRCSEVTAGEAETTIGEGDPVSPTWLKTVSPDFMEPWLGAGWRYANDIKVSIYGRREFGAAAFPPEAHTVASLFGFGDSRDWRISAGGIS